MASMLGSRLRSAMPAMRAGRLALPAIALMVFALAGAPAASANGVPLASGDVLAGVGNGTINHFDSSGKLLDQLNTGTSATYETGMCFDSAGNLYTTNFSGMSEFDARGNLLVSAFGSGFNEHPESCLFDSSNNIYVGQPDGTKQVLKFTAAGSPLGAFFPQTGPRGTDWLDLSPDGCSLSYTSEGTELKRFDVCANAQLPVFATGLPAPCYAHRILPDGSDLVACASAVEHVSAAGEVLHTYSLAGSSELFALNIDPDKKTFWTGDITSGKIWRIDIETGAVVASFTTPINTGLYGLAVVGEITAPPKITLAPPAAENPVGTTHTVTATVTEHGVSQQGVSVSFTVTGVNPTGGSASTNETGEASFTFKGNNPGLDSILATFVDKAGRTDESNIATKSWVGEKIEKTKKEEEDELLGLDPTSLTTTLASIGQSGGEITVPAEAAVSDHATLHGTNAHEASGTVTYAVYSDPTCSNLAADAGTVQLNEEAKIPASKVMFLAPGTYYWQASYAGDPSNLPSQSVCGTEVLHITPGERHGEAPEFGRCVKVKAGTGIYASGTCTAEGGTKTYSWLPGVVKRGFTITLKIGLVTLEATKGLKVVCTGAAGEGEYAGAKTVSGVLLTLTGCEKSGVKCQTAGSAEGELVSELLAGKLGVISLGETAVKNKIGLDLAPEAGVEAVLGFTCGAQAVSIRGSVIVPVTTNKMLLSSNLIYAASAKGKQNPSSFLGSPVDVLEISLDGGVFLQTALKVKLIQAGEEKVEINSVN
jgi:hypothetical protein